MKKSKKDISPIYLSEAIDMLLKLRDARIHTYDEVKKVLKSEKRSTIVYDTQNELADMTVNDFTNLIDKHDLGIAELDAMFYDLLEILVKERTKDE
jgi:hypothetical protein